ncbi:uncharacterized protein K452DRAFT_303438 [Aplosporella prunicola CBS 121167]|uniref:Uncharacterized protein n=1 Tax=Aplosporella prunicola CBS 121167 TaxID=1176127 RepID=A0A6A6AWM3_9PEZI|nr:uncharacterized protein K452DRAFT_303438 [Aplosporella prunicola CBS 121167]KAF2135583.1 hypothetical protein K452DRAFT_303438 [Aplosporella prunicola CBS 121167]
MQIKDLIIAFTVLTSATVIAAPSKKRSCPNDYWYCGVCNGTKCKIAATNYECTQNTACTGSGAGDGAVCGTKNDNFFNIGADIECPHKN